MGSFNIEYISNNMYVDDISDNLYYDSPKKEIKEWLNSSLSSVSHYLKQGYEVKICSLDILGNRKEGYDFNGIYGRTVINNIEEFINFWNENTQKLFSKRLLKKVRDEHKES